MSYGCQISFKKLNPEEVFPFLQEFKKKCVDNVEYLAKDNFIFSPLFKCNPDREKIDPTSWDKNTIELKDKVETWLSNSILKFRWFYFVDKNILGVYGVDNILKDIFDNTTYFQNSTDQDYDYEVWNGIDFFEKVANNWRTMSDEDILEIDPECEDFEYFRKESIYNCIWKMFESTLEDDSTALYISMIGFLDFQTKKKAWNAIVEKYNEFLALDEARKKEKIK